MQKKVPYVAQLGNMDCSIACMTMLFRYYGLDVDIVDVGQVVHIGRDGVNLTQLKQATQQFGFKCTAYRYNKQKNILDSNLPAVVYSGSHLAVIGSKTVLGQYILLDPIKGKSIVNFEQIHDTFSDILITIRPEKRIKRKKCKPKLKVAINYKLVAGIISLMLLIQALTLSIPLVEQALIDSITQSQSLLNSAYILVGCIVIAGLYFFLSIARQKLMLRLDISFVKEIMTKMLKKLFDIDPSFFEWHAVGEIVNRFSNVQAINNIIINTFSQVAVQIITSTICLVTMFVYSPSLSVITIAIGTIELVLLLGINKKNREDTSKYIADQSNMQGLLAEAIGNIIEIRCMGMEKAIYKNLTNQFLDELESFRKKSNTGNQMLAISSTITLIFPLIIYILGYSSVVNEALTIGQLIAYVTLANYFISPFVSIVIALPNLNFVYEVFLRYKELITYRETHAVLAALKNAASCNDDVHIIFRYVTAIVRLGFFVVVCRQGCFDFFVLFFLGIDVVHFQRAYFIAARSIFRQVKGQLLVLTDSFFRVNGRDKFVVIDQCGDGSSNAVPRQMRFRAAGQVGPLPEKQTIAFFIESNAGIIFQQKLRKHDLVALTDIPQPVDQQRCFTEKGKDVRIGSARGRICFQQERQQLCRKFGQRKSGGRWFALRSCGFFRYTSYSIGRIISSACCFRLLHICAQPRGFVLRSGICAFCIRSRSVLSTICCASSPILRQLDSSVPSSIIWSHRFGSFCSK